MAGAMAFVSEPAERAHVAGGEETERGPAMAEQTPRQQREVPAPVKAPQGGRRDMATVVTVSTVLAAAASAMVAYFLE